MLFVYGTRPSKRKEEAANPSSTALFVYVPNESNWVTKFVTEESSKDLQQRLGNCQVFRVFL